MSGRQTTVDQLDWQLLKATPLFGATPDEAVLRLIGDGGPKTFDKGKLLFQQGEPADAFYVILDGWVKISRMSRDGEETIVGVFTRGETFAEAAMFINTCYKNFHGFSLKMVSAVYNRRVLELH